MSLQFKKLIVAIFALAFLAAVITVGFIEKSRHKPANAGYAYADETTKKCIDCHDEKHIAVVWNRQWENSRHAQKGIGCQACHEAKEGDPDLWEHEGFNVTQVPSPMDCKQCHEKEVEQFTNSHHAQATQFIGSMDNLLGEIVEGTPAANMGCRQCHGSIVQLDDKARPIAGTWPNTGIGRINPDGSNGTCTACHLRHNFALEQVREPATCGRCHMGPDHPQIEIYEESKHGINFVSHRDEMNLASTEWVVGVDYIAAPTCATCHVSATPTMEVTHDIGARISRTNRPPVSKDLENPEERRGLMKKVCTECHGETWVENFYVMYDTAVDHYNRKFGIPARDIMDELKKAGKLTATPFDEELEWVYFELWHHEGRRARMGASMMGPDYTQWHGFYEVAQHFYIKFLPQAEKLKPGVTRKVRAMKEHQWLKGMTEEQRKSNLEFYKKRYDQEIH